MGFENLIHGSESDKGGCLQPSYGLQNEMQRCHGNWISQKSQEDLYVQAKKTEMHVQAELVQRQIREEGEVRRQNMKIKAENRKEALFLSEDGRPYLKVSLLGDDEISGTLCDARFPELYLLKPVNGSEDGILLGKVIMKNGTENQIWINLGKLSPKYVRRKFCSAGIFFTCTPRKEREFAFRLITLLKEKSQEVQIYLRPGWFMKSDGGIEYVDESKMLWKEAVKIAE